MKPKKVTEFIEVEYWACNVPVHRHKTLAVAKSCVDKSLARKSNKWTVDSMGDAFEAVLDGATFKSVGLHYGVSGNRMAEVVYKVRRMAAHPSVLSVPFPDHDTDSGVDGMRRHADFWKNQIAILRTKRC